MQAFLFSPVLTQNVLFSYCIYKLFLWRFLRRHNEEFIQSGACLFKVWQFWSHSGVCRGWKLFMRLHSVPVIKWGFMMRLKPCRLAGFSLFKSFWLPSHFGWNVLQFCVSKKSWKWWDFNVRFVFCCLVWSRKEPLCLKLLITKLWFWGVLESGKMLTCWACGPVLWSVYHFVSQHEAPDLCRLKRQCLWFHLNQQSFWSRACAVGYFGSGPEMSETLWSKWFKIVFVHLSLSEADV